MMAEERKKRYEDFLAVVEWQSVSQNRNTCRWKLKQARLHQKTVIPQGEEKHIGLNPLHLLRVVNFPNVLPGRTDQDVFYIRTADSPSVHFNKHKSNGNNID